jgi:hypothetical protein
MTGVRRSAAAPLLGALIGFVHSDAEFGKNQSAQARSGADGYQLPAPLLGPHTHPNTRQTSLKPNGGPD